MDDDYKEVRSTGKRPLPWKKITLPKFAMVPERKPSIASTITENKEGSPLTPPPSPMHGPFKYPPLLRDNNFWPKTFSVDTIVTKLSENIKTDVAEKQVENNYQDNMHSEHKPVQKAPQKLQSFMNEIKPAPGRTKMYLWPQSAHRTDSSKLDLHSSSTRKNSSESKSQTFKEAKKTHECFAETPASEKSEQPKKADVVKTRKSLLDSTSFDDFQIVLRHALSHDPVIAGYDSTSRIQRCFPFVETPKKLSM